MLDSAQQATVWENIWLNLRQSR